ncbi:MAG: MCE family protein [Proteobacteria bacterium]|nr:MCE family protein [Pseudomonadota bacterium]
MERNAHYAAIGLATSVLFLGLLLFVIWFARFQVARDYDIYNVVFYGPVRGLSDGGEVHFNGIKVGEVTRLQLDPANASRVIARVRLTSSVPVKTDSKAQLEPQGITGVSYIQISAGSQNAQLLKKVTPPDQIPVIASQPSPLSELLEGGGTVLTKTVEALNRVNRVLSDDNIKNLSGTMSDIHEVSTELRLHKAVIAKAEIAIENAAEAAKNFNEVAKSGRNLLDGDGARAIKNIEHASAEIDAAAKDVRALISKVQGPTSDFASNGLPQLTATAASLQQTSEALNQLLREARSSPQGLIAKPPSKEVKVKP